MDYQLKTHCPHCFKRSNTAICSSCQFNREVYLSHHAAVHHLPLFTHLEKGYVVGRVLGESRFAIVYAAIRVKDQLLCAIKEFYPHDLAQRGLDNKTIKPTRQQEPLMFWQNRFIQEAQLLRSCYDHPSVESGIVRYTDLIQQHNTVYLVMEWLTGMSLTEVLSQQKLLSAAKICLWLKPLLETLQKLHAKEIYHRNISPNNIFICAENQPVLMDFGLARENLRDELLRFSSLTAGSFIAPEQLSGGQCDYRTDLYALGAVIYLCLHGEVPPSMDARRQGATLKVLNSADKTAQALQTVAAHCLQLNANLRPKNVAHLLADLAPFWLASSETITPTAKNSHAPRINPRLQATQNTGLPPPLTKPHSFLRSLVFFLCVLAAVVSSIYAGFIAYQNYELKEAEQRKQDNLLFSQSQTIADYKNYLSHCITCENQQRAMERMTQLEQEQRALLSQQKQAEQEALLFNNAQTIDELKIYLKNCVQCADKAKAEEKLATLTEAAKLADEQQLAEQEKEIVTALKTKGSSVDFYQQNCPKNIVFWQRTAEQGYAIAQLLLGGCYRSGDGIKQDYAEALNWYRKAAEQGNAYAQNNLATMYQNGYGSAKNEAEASKWYRKAAEQRLPAAQYFLGMMYETGKGLTQDYKQAVDWYLKAAEQGHADAQYSLATMYHYGSGVTQDYQAALSWYRKSAEQGNDKAQYLLGIMYQNGYGVDIDEQEALNWYQKAADQGNADAVAQIKTLDVAKTPASFSAE